jgi:hypothetical protein
MKEFQDIIRVVISLWLVLIMFLIIVMIADPKLVGRWLADVDIAYDEVWMDHIGDCDCTESLE